MNELKGVRHAGGGTTQPSHRPLSYAEFNEHSCLNGFPEKRWRPIGRRKRQRKLLQGVLAPAKAFLRERPQWEA